MSQKKNSQNYIREQLQKWREERQSRMAARVLHKREGTVSSAVFGSIASATVNKSTTSNRSQQNKPSTIHSRQRFASSGVSGTTTATGNKSIISDTSLLSTTSTGVPKFKHTRSSSAKRTGIPEIKHTLASKLRLIKANPLLEKHGIITIPKKSKKDGTKDKLKGKLDSQPSVPSVNKKVQFQKAATSRPTQQPSVKEDTKGKENVPSTSKTKQMNRRSLSAGSLCRKPDNDKEEKHMKRFHSAANLEASRISVIAEEDSFESDIAPLPVTPVTSQTPRTSRYTAFANSLTKRSAHTPSTSIFTPTPDVLRKQLSDWLKKRGKTLSNFHHLHCFGLHASRIAPNFDHLKECKVLATPQRNKPDLRQVEQNQQLKSIIEPEKEVQNTAEQEPIDSDENKENMCIGNSEVLAQDALDDLLKIIQMGYPSEQCDQWLTTIRRSFPGVKEVPIYWECLAALEEAWGDFRSAVDCYERAIIRGAPPEKVSSSLDKLMEKFNLLHLNENLKNDETSKTPRKQVLDARNIFKSSIIRFALQQKAVRSLSSDLGVSASSLNYVVTPVRRSTRISSSRYSTTPGMLCVKSLNQLEPEIRKSMVFQQNQALNKN